MALGLPATPTLTSRATSIETGGRPLAFSLVCLSPAWGLASEFSHAHHFSPPDHLVPFHRFVGESPFRSLFTLNPLRHTTHTPRCPYNEPPTVRRSSTRPPPRLASSCSPSPTASAISSALAVISKRRLDDSLRRINRRRRPLTVDRTPVPTPALEELQE